MKYSTHAYYRLNVNETGFLEVSVFDNNNIPIPNAVVTIAKISYTGLYNESAEGEIIAEFLTDNNGKLHVELPILNDLLGKNAFYSAQFVKEGYYNTFIYYIQIYPNIHTIYEVYMSQRIEGHPEKLRFFFQPKKGTIHLH